MGTERRPSPQVAPLRIHSHAPVPGTVQSGEIVENKRLGAALALVKEQQAAYAPNQRRYDPARQRPPNNLEVPG